MARKSKGSQRSAVIKGAARHLQRASGAAVNLLCQVVKETQSIDESSLAELLNEFVSERMRLAKEFWSTAKRLKPETPADHIAIIGRAYYAMYHAARAVVFAHKRTDVDKHEELPGHLPRGGFAKEGYWQDRLGYWRTVRNDLDYSPWPNQEVGVESLAKQVLKEAHLFILECEVYLKGRVRNA